MKFLDYPAIGDLSRQLTFESAGCNVFTRLEAYSCKAVKRERQLFKVLESQYLETASLSPPHHLDEMLSSPFGRLDQPAARKTLFLLIATLNAAFPDHDFSDVNPADFRREASSDSVLTSLGTTLLSLRSSSNAPRTFSSFGSSYDGDGSGDANYQRSRQAAGGVGGQGVGSIQHPQLASILDDVMDIADCEVYTFHPDADSDPHACAEPDEEGELMDDERYADDEDNTTDDELNSSVGYGESRSHSRVTRSDTTFDRDSVGDEDAPMFDEDLLGSGFTPVHSRVSSTVTTPRTPSLNLRARGGDYFQMKGLASAQRSSHAQLSASMPAMPIGRRAYTHSFHDDGDYIDGELYADEDEAAADTDSGLNGLLWATYAFFYNKKLKRVLFVSVWSRRSTAHLPVSYSFSPPSYPVSRSVQGGELVAERHVPPISLDRTIAAAMHDDNRGGGKDSSPLAKQGTGLQVETPSPAKRAIAKSTGGSDRRGRGLGRVARSGGAGMHRQRSLSGSPAPSALSPFPHDAIRVLHPPQPALSSHTTDPREGVGLSTGASAEPIAVQPAGSITKRNSVRDHAALDGHRGISSMEFLSPSSSSSASSATAMSASTKSALSGGSAFSSSINKRGGEPSEMDHRQRFAGPGSAPKQRRI